MSAVGASIVDTALQAAGLQPRSLLGSLLRRLFVSAASGVGGNNIVWSPSGQGTAKTWSEVRAQIATKKGPGPIFVADPGNYPVSAPGEVTDLHGMYFLAPFGDPSDIALQVADGAQLRNIGADLSFGSINGGMRLELFSTGAVAPLAWDLFVPGSPRGLLSAAAGARFINRGTVPAAILPPNEFAVVALRASGSIAAGDNLAPLLRIGSGGTVLFTAENEKPQNVWPGWVEDAGDSTNAIILQCPNYEVGSVATWFNAPTATYLNSPVNMLGGSGPLALRPTGFFGPVSDGTVYYADDLATPRSILWNVALNQWTDMLGAPLVPPVGPLEGNASL